MKRTAISQVLVLMVGIVVSMAMSAPASAASRSTVAGLPQASGQPTTVYMSPNGKGDCATAAQACNTFTKAIAVVAAHGTVLLAGGKYSAQTISQPRQSSGTKAVVLQPAAGQSPLLSNLRVNASGLTFSHLAMYGNLYLTSLASYTTVDAAHVYGPDASILIRGSHVTVTDSLIEGGHGHDGINIAGHPAKSTDITVRGTTIRDFTSKGARTEHPDCIQLFDTSNVTVAHNNLFDCYNSGITFSRGAGKGVSSVVIDSNFIQGCIASRQRCGQGGSSMDLRLRVTNVQVINNSFGAGSLRLPLQAGVEATRNIVNFLSTYSCASSLTHSVVLAYSKGFCHVGLPGASNWQTAVSYANPAGGDLHLTASVAVPVSEMSTLFQPKAMFDIDGNATLPTSIGADQRTLTPPGANKVSRPGFAAGTI